MFRILESLLIHDADVSHCHNLEQTIIIIFVIIKTFHSNFFLKLIFIQTHILYFNPHFT
jgi:hypothetical protein